jgi:two-component system chemotaxis response regulator CheB
VPSSLEEGGTAPPIRLLIADDSSLVRRLTMAALKGQAEIAVIGAVGDGQAALDAIAGDRPDVVMLDIEMPVMDGLTALKMIKLRWPSLPVLIFSTLAEHGAAATLKALELGAADYVTKPSGVTHAGEAVSRVRNEVVPKVKAICRGRAPRGPSLPAAAEGGPPAPARPRPPRADCAVVTLGSSTGGPNALIDVLSGLPALGVPMLIVQHMPPVFTRLLAQRLDQCCPMPVMEVDRPVVLQPGHVYLAAGGRHLVVERRLEAVWAVPNDEPVENNVRPSVNLLFRSAAAVYGPGVLGVVLTGMGSDGQAGSEAIVQAGGSVIVQDDATSVTWGMPGAVARAGLADRVLPLAKMAPEIVARASGRAPALAGRGSSAGSGACR